MFSTRQVVSLLRGANPTTRVTEEQIRRAVRREQVVPSGTFAGRLAWSPEDVVDLAVALGLVPPQVCVGEALGSSRRGGDSDV